MEDLKTRHCLIMKISHLKRLLMLQGLIEGSLTMANKQSGLHGAVK